MSHADPVGTIQNAVCAAFGCSRRELVSRRRPDNLVTARHVAYWLSRRCTELSLPDIGRQFADRHHTTIMHGISRVDERMRGDVEFVHQVRQLLKTIRW